MNFQRIDLESWRFEALQHPIAHNSHIWTGIRRFERRQRQGRPAQWIRLQVNGVTVGAYMRTQRGVNSKLNLIDVFAAHRGKGYGRALLEHAIEDARENGAARLKINGAKGARAFYAACGLTAIPKTNFDFYCIELT
jgi:GNAT superfamily N-acetyltransferase